MIILVTQGYVRVFKKRKEGRKEKRNKLGVSAS